MKITFDLNDSDLEKIFGVKTSSENDKVTDGPLYYSDLNRAEDVLKFMREMITHQNYVSLGDVWDHLYRPAVLSDYDNGWTKGEVDQATVIYNKPLKKYQITLNEAHKIDPTKLYAEKLSGEKKHCTVRRGLVDSVNVELMVFDDEETMHKFMDDIRIFMIHQTCMTVNDYEILCGHNLIADQAIHDEEYGWTKEELKQEMRVRTLEDGKYIIYLPEAYKLDRKESK